MNNVDGGLLVYEADMVYLADISNIFNDFNLHLLGADVTLTKANV